MLEDIDIQKLIEANRKIFATKEDFRSSATKEDLKSFATKEDLEPFATKEDLTKFVTLEEFDGFREESRDAFKSLHQLFNELTTSVDAYAHKADTYFQEMVMLSHKVDRHEQWFHKIADKLGIKLEY